jgi:hypothetical protein
MNKPVAVCDGVPPGQAGLIPFGDALGLWARNRSPLMPPSMAPLADVEPEDHGTAMFWLIIRRPDFAAAKCHNPALRAGSRRHL